MSTFQPADVVKVHRPGRALHGCLGRVLDPVPDTNLIWVAFRKEGAQTYPPTEADYRRTNKAIHKLLPLSNLQKVTT